MLLNIIFLIFGFLLVIKGGEWFVEASVDIAHRFKISRIVIGGTIVSLATTAPELVVSVTASRMGDSGIALGNAVGSAIANIGLIVGVAACMTVIKVDLKEFRMRSLWMLGSAVLVILFTWSLSMNRLFGIILLLIALLYLILDYWSITHGGANAPETVPTTETAASESLKKPILLFLAGAVLVIIGSRFLVISGIGIAQALGIPSVIIGLSVIAIGTSLPELVTAVVSSRKGVPDLAIGNIVGANVLNLAMIIGLACVIRPLTLTRFTQLYSFPWLLIFIFAMIWMFRRDGLIARKGGLIFLSLYVIYIAGLIVFPMLGI